MRTSKNDKMIKILWQQFYIDVLGDIVLMLSNVLLVT